ncbi:MAG: hypothetical protein NTY19_29515, partial [Planctomycetota bacterium]|nr:hypothetical protein [Planctomycetota bacterium]
MRSSAAISVLVCVLLSMMASAAWGAGGRKWTDAKGTVIANDAKFVRVYKDKESKDNRNPNPGAMPGAKGDVNVYLDFHGRPVIHSFLELSPEDQQFIRDELERKKATDAKAAEQSALLPVAGAAGNMPGSGMPGASMPGMSAPGMSAPGMSAPGMSGAVATSPVAEERMWTSAQGKKIKAKLVRADAANVILLKDDGKELTVLLTQLSEADQAYVRGQSQGGPAPGGMPPGMVNNPGSAPGSGSYPGSMPPGSPPAGSPPGSSTMPGMTPGSGSYSGSMPPGSPPAGSPPGSSTMPGMTPGSGSYSGSMPPGSPPAGSPPGSST